jgi:hypothetical protein
VTANTPGWWLAAAALVAVCTLVLLSVDFWADRGGSRRSAGPAARAETAAPMRSAARRLPGAPIYLHARTSTRPPAASAPRRRTWRAECERSTSLIGRPLAFGVAAFTHSQIAAPPKELVPADAAAAEPSACGHQAVSGGR